MTLLRGTAIEKRAVLRRGQQLTILAGVDFEVDAGERVAILGRSGSGKSTLLSIAGLLDSPTGGRYLVAGQDVALLSPAKQARLRGELFGFVFQRFCLLGHLTAAENVETGALHRGEARAGRRRAALAALDEVGLLSRAQHRPGQLSGGEQQRVAIARALAGRPSVVLADEPTGSLDEDNGARIVDLLHELAARSGVTVVLVTHDPVVAAGCDRTITLDRGRVAA